MQTISPLDPTGTFYCSLNSAAVGELLSGTASQESAWLMIEYPGIWKAKALTESGIPSQVKDHLSSWTESNPQARIQLIRRSEQNPGAKISIFLVFPDQDHPILYKWLLDDYNELLDINFVRYPGSEAIPESNNLNLLFLVCTNGQRDRCCSKFGVPVYKSLSAQYPGQVWETTHLGGHRFAANLLCFPHGVLYGRVTPTDAMDIARRYETGSLLLKNYRGRVGIPEAAQAAEYYLREELQERRLEAFSFQRLDHAGEFEWQAAFLNNETGQTNIVTLHQDPDSLETYMNCSDDKSQLVSQYFLKGIEPIPRP